MIGMGTTRHGNDYTFGSGGRLVTFEPRHLRRSGTPLAERLRLVRDVKACTACDDACVGGKRVHQQPIVWKGVKGVGQQQQLGQTHPPTELVVLGERESWDATWITLRGFGWENVAFIDPLACATPDRRPSNDEYAMCAGNINDLIHSCNTNHVLLVGRRAWDFWRPDLKVGEHAGVRGIMWGMYAVCGIAHWESTRGSALDVRRWKRELDEWARFVDLGDVGVERLTRDLTNKDCTEYGCSEFAADIDPDGLTWCKAHRNERWLQARQGTGVAEPAQGTLL
jgi:uracil-DNA glycosylase